MKILVTGRQGQVVRSLLERFGSGEVEIEAVGRPSLDLSEPASVAREITYRKPDIVVSAAAYTSVDSAEGEPELAMAVNARGAEAVAQAAASVGAAIIHLSTDYVFDGQKGGPYTEEDAPNPQNVYGRTKLEGERAVALANPRHVILRTAWAYSPFGSNFAKTMLALAREKKEIAVVSDRLGNPTSALDIADGVIRMAGSIVEGSGSFGVFHLAGTGATSWSGFAEHIFSVSRAAGGPSARVIPISAEDYPAKAKRPLNSCLATDKLHQNYEWRAPGWKMSCEVVVHRLLQSL